MGKKFDYKKWVTENKYGSLNEQNGNVVLGYECPEVIPFFNNTDYCVNSSSPEYGQWVNTCCSDEGNIPLGYTCPENLPVFNPNPDQYPPNYCTNATSFSQYSYFVNACCGEEPGTKSARSPLSFLISSTDLTLPPSTFSNPCLGII